MRLNLKPMHKPGTTKDLPVLTLNESTLQAIANALTLSKDAERPRLIDEIHSIERAIESNEQSIARYLNEVGNYQRDTKELADMKVKEETKLANLPPPVEVSTDEVKKDLAKVLALPFIKEVSYDTHEGSAYIVATTRENSLFTTLNRKFSKNDRWYSVKPYTIPLPAYKIWVGLNPGRTAANNEQTLCLSLAYPQKDTSNMYQQGRYSQKIHAHWAARHRNLPSMVCLGEYEGQVSTALRTNLAEGLIELATFLQMSGAAHGYITSRHEWAFRMGKAEYNPLIVPSMDKKTDDAELDDEEDEECGCRDSDGDCTTFDCSCECHL